MTTYHVSGHIHITDGEFAIHYVPRLEAALAEGASFVVGDAQGVDLHAQVWLAKRTADVTVFHMFDSPRNNAGFPTKGGYQSDTKRDAAMTRASDDDIAWVRPGREKSGTAKNLARRERFVYLRVLTQMFRDGADEDDIVTKACDIRQGLSHTREGYLTMVEDARVIVMLEKAAEA